ncbi:hypothetical protein Y032_0265g642 [Ancylostoma ceylanicum]|uniref:Protein zer-1 homolog-like C-terminal domain-containing protein n=1 Tax=Ancylostoma ceylanicum TaxID=53326 RepID=A0A016S9E4_9BILA|nr:hypothetical protein Y032_0265g642 [Ancylostoma ceylanicum]
MVVKNSCVAQLQRVRKARQQNTSDQRGQIVLFRSKSFEPFVRILNETNLVGAQMWCLWGVNHVLSHSDANSVSMGYMTMLMESDLLAHCIRLSKDSSVDEGVRELAIRIETNWLERTIHGMRVNAALTDQVESPSIPQMCA